MNTLLHCHFCIQIITHHFMLSKVSRPIHTIPGINAHLLHPILCPWKYSIRHKLLYCPICIFGCFHGNHHCVVSCHYFYTWGRGDSTGSGCNKYGETILETSCFAKIVYGLSCVHGGHDLSWLCLGAMITHDCVLGP